MSYIGNPITQSAFLTDQFSGTGSQTAFTMSVAPANTAAVVVAIHGVVQDPSTYSVTGTTLTFSAAPPAGTGNISARYLGIPASGVTTTAYRTVSEFTATSSQSVFTPPAYTVGFLEVYRNGIRLGAADFTASNGVSVVLATPANNNDLVTIVSFYVSSVLNAIPATANAVNSLYLSPSLNLVTPNIGAATGTSLTAPIHNSATTLSLQTGGTTAVTILGNSAVGVGTTTPISTMQVNGTLSLSDNSQISTLSSLGMRNRIINGSIVVDQRNVGNSVYTSASSGTSATVFSADRWSTYIFNYSGSFSANVSTQQYTDNPLTTYGKCLRVTVNTAATPQNNVDFLVLMQKIEANNCWDMNNKPMAVSFWVKTNSVGTYGVQLRCNGSPDGLTNPNYCTTFSVTNSGVWTYVTLSIPAQTLSYLAPTNVTGYTLYVTLVSGLNQNTSGNSGIAACVNAWARYSSDGISATTLTNTLTSSTSNYFQLADVQFEPGAVATPFEWRPYTIEEALCKRYYEKSYAQSVVPANGALGDSRQGPICVFNSNSGETNQIKFAVTKRTTPTMTFYSSSATGASAGQWSYYPGGWYSAATTVSAQYDSYFTVGLSSLTGVTNYYTYITSGGWAASAEL